MIGPHEGKELELMLAGKKHLAAFGDAIPENSAFEEWMVPEKLFAPYVADGTLKRFEETIVSAPFGHIILNVCFTTPGHEWRAEAFFCLQKLLHTYQLRENTPFDIMKGRLLGYREADVMEFVQRAHPTPLVPKVGKIGPHQDKELQLMLAGKKHMAYFSDIIPESGVIAERIIPEKRFAPYVANGTFKRFEQTVTYLNTDHTSFQVCYTLPGHEWRAETFLCLKKMFVLHSIYVDAAFEFIIGRLLDYSDSDIKAFLQKIYSDQEKRQLASIF